MSSDCLFCRLVAGEVAATRVSEGERTYDHRLARSPDAVTAFREASRSTYFDPAGRAD